MDFLVTICILVKKCRSQKREKDSTGNVKLCNWKKQVKLFAMVWFRYRDYCQYREFLRLLIHLCIYCSVAADISNCIIFYRMSTLKCIAGSLVPVRFTCHYQSELRIIKVYTELR